MMTEARETMTEALITGQAVVGRVFGHLEGLEIQRKRKETTMKDMERHEMIREA